MADRSRELSILVTAKNMSARILGQVRGDINNLDSTARRAGSNMGRNIGIGVAAVGAGLALQVRSGIDSLVELERVEKLTAAALESTGNRANQSADGIRARAEAMEALTGVDDKVVQNAQNLLLTFTNVTEDAFEPTLEAALNLNAALGGNDESLQGVLLQVAKAVNDPVRGMTALRRSGVSFTQEQQDQVKAMVEANDMMGAQALILGELETQFGGAAEAANQGAGRAQKRFSDAIEEMQMALATGFMPLIERASGALQTLVADPAFIAGVEDFGETLAGGFDAALDFAEGVDWDAVGSALQTMGGGAKMAMDAFLGAPPWLQTAILTGWGLNKLTGGALGTIVGELGKGLVKGVLGMNAGVVNVRGAVVNAPGGPGAPGGRGGGGRGRIPFVPPVWAGPAAAVAAPLVLTGSENPTAAMNNLRIVLEKQLAAGEISQAEAVAQWEAAFGRTVIPKIDGLTVAQDRATAAARDAIPWAQRIQAEVHNQNMSEANRHAVVQAAENARHQTAIARASEALAIERGQAGSLSRIASRNPVTNVTVINQISINEWQRRVTSAIRAASPGSFVPTPF